MALFSDVERRRRLPNSASDRWLDVNVCRFRRGMSKSTSGPNPWLQAEGKSWRQRYCEWENAVHVRWYQRGRQRDWCCRRLKNVSSCRAPEHGEVRLKRSGVPGSCVSTVLRDTTSTPIRNAGFPLLLIRWRGRLRRQHSWLSEDRGHQHDSKRRAIHLTVLIGCFQVIGVAFGQPYYRRRERERSSGDVSMQNAGLATPDSGKTHGRRHPEV